MFCVRASTSSLRVGLRVCVCVLCCGEVDREGVWGCVHACVVWVTDTPGKRRGFVCCRRMHAYTNAHVNKCADTPLTTRRFFYLALQVVRSGRRYFREEWLEKCDGGWARQGHDPHVGGHFDDRRLGSELQATSFAVGRTYRTVEG